MKYAYMHTIKGEPARYKEGKQIYYVHFLGKFIGKLVPSLKQIRKEQKLSTAWRKKNGFPISEYSYIKVRTARRTTGEQK